MPLARKGFIILSLKGKTLPESMVLKTIEMGGGGLVFPLNIGR